MGKLWEDFIIVLNHIVQVYQAFLNLTKEKKAVLVAAKASELERITKQEEVLILQAGKLEELRNKIAADLAKERNLSGDTITFAQLQMIAAPEHAQKLKQFQEQMGAITKELEPLNKLNLELIQQALGFIQYNINVLSQSVAAPTYAAKGKDEPVAERTRAIFDTKI